MKERLAYAVIGIFLMFALFYVSTIGIVFSLKTMFFIVLMLFIAFLSSIAFALQILSPSLFAFVFMFATVLLIRPKLSFLLYSEKKMYVPLNLQILLNLLFFWWIKLNALITREKYKNKLALPFVLLIIGSILSSVNVLDFRVYFLWLVWNVFLFSISENVAYVIHRIMHKESSEGIYKLYVIVLFVMSIPLFLSLVIKGYGEATSMLIRRAKGIFTSPNSLGVLAAVNVFLWWGYFIHSKELYKKVFSVGAILVEFYLIYISVSRNALLSLILGIGLFVFAVFSKTIKRKYIIISGIMSLLIVGLIFIIILKYAGGFTERLSTAISGREVSTLLRILMAKYTVEFQLHNPLRALIGSGPYQFYYYKFSFGLEKPHILLLDWWFSFGILGVIAFFLLVYRSFIAPMLFLFKNRTWLSRREYLFRSSILISLAVFWFSTLFDEVFWVPHHPILMGLIVPYLSVSYQVIMRKI